MKLTKRRGLGAANLTAATAIGAGNAPRAGFSATTATIRTVFRTSQRHLSRGSPGRFFKTDLNVQTNIIALSSHILAARAVAAATGAIKEHVKNIPKIRAAKTTKAACAAAISAVHSVRAKLVIARALFRVRKHIIGFIDLFHLGFCGFAVRI